jgi:hypothetical protein
MFFPFFRLYFSAKVTKIIEDVNFLAIFFGDLDKNIYFCPRLLTIKKLLPIETSSTQF